MRVEDLVECLLLPLGGATCSQSGARIGVGVDLSTPERPLREHHGTPSVGALCSAL